MPTENIKRAGHDQEEQLQQNYDKAELERKRPMAKVTVAGKEFDIPAQAPAWVPLFIARYGEGEQKEVPEDKYLDFLIKIIGNDIVDHMIEVADNSFSGEDLRALVDEITSIWNPRTAKKKRK